MIHLNDLSLVQVLNLKEAAGSVVPQIIIHTPVVVPVQVVRIRVKRFLCQCVRYIALKLTLLILMRL